MWLVACLTFWSVLGLLIWYCHTIDEIERAWKRYQESEEEWRMLLDKAYEKGAWDTARVIERRHQGRIF